MFVRATYEDLCPVRAVTTYAAVRESASGAFFHFQDGTPLAKPRFVEAVRQALGQAGIPSEGYSGHSFRLGAATAAAQCGLQDSIIQALGRWASPAYLRYIRIPRDHLARHSLTIAAGRRT